MRHYQAVLRLDTTNPPGNEHLAVEYLKKVFDAENIPSQVFALDPNRSNIVARLKGNGKKRPLLIMGHTDDVTVDASKWKFPPFSATRDGGYVYARGTIDDKDNLTAGLMTMVLLKRMQVPLDRDVIFLAESGEEGNSNFGIQFMVAQHFEQIDAEVLLRGGRRCDADRRRGAVRDGPDHREDPARHRAGGARDFRTRLDSLEVERDRPPGGSGGENRRVAPRRALQRDDRHLFPRVSRRSRRPTSQLTTGTCCRRTRRCAPPPTTGSPSTSRSTRRCCRRRCRPTSSPAGTARTSFRRKPRRRSTSACCRTRIRRRFSTR